MGRDVDCASMGQEAVSDENLLISQESLGGGEVMEELPADDPTVVLIHEDREEWEVVPSSRKKMAKPRKCPAVVARKSARIPATCRPTGGNSSSTTGKSSLSSCGFTVLNSFD